MNTTIDRQDRTWAMICHLAALVGNFIPFGNIIGPLVVWLVKKEESAYIDYHGKEALNFQLSLTIYFFIAGILAFLLIGLPLLFVLWAFAIIVVIIAGMKANDGVYYKYPLTIRFLK